MGIIRRLVATGEHIGHATEDEARAFFQARKDGGHVGVVVTPDGPVTLHEEQNVESLVKQHTEDAGVGYQGPPKEGEDTPRANPQKYAGTQAAAQAAAVAPPALDRAAIEAQIRAEIEAEQAQREEPPQWFKEWQAAQPPAPVVDHGDQDTQAQTEQTQQ